MGRSGGRSGGSRSAPPPARRAPPPAAPQQRAPPPPAISQAPPQQGGMLSGLGSVMAQGFAFGTGSSIARNVVDSVMGGGNSNQPQQAPVQQYQAPVQQNVCEFDRNALLKCMNETPSNCDFYYQALQACQQNNMN